jgi:two-component system, LytTR family, sensor kinase
MNRSEACRFGSGRLWGLDWTVTGWRRLATKRKLRIFGGWALVVTIFASQWLIYDEVQGRGERVTYYLITSAYLWGVLTPAVLWLVSRRPIEAQTWKTTLPLHIAASLALTGLGVFLEATIGWLPHASGWDYPSALRHYFRQHTQISLLAYCVLDAAAHVWRMYDQARRRELHTAQLEARLAEARLSALRTQLQPHFLFNSLQAATTLIHADPEGAEEVLLALSELLRTSLQALQRQEVTLDEEIAFLKHYTSIQQRRFGDRLHFEYHLDSADGGYAVPSLALQPLVENAIRHGIGKHKEADTVSIGAYSRDDRLHLEVANLASTLEDEPERLFKRGVGLANTRARLEQLYGNQQSFEIRRSRPRGVVVSMTIPRRSLAGPELDLAVTAR